MSGEEQSILEKLDAAVPVPLAQFDAFPKLPSTYKARSESRGFMTIFVGLLALLLMLNDISEYIWGWTDFEFSVDNDMSSYLSINVDMVVNMPCKYLTIDLRDAMGDRLFLSGGLRRDGTKFDVGQTTALKAHSEALSVQQAVAQSRKSRGFFSFWRRNQSGFRPTYSHEANGSACRIWGTLMVKRVTANFHVTTLGHGYSSYEHVDHSLMNLSHVITEFSFGPHFPDIAQPLDFSFEATNDPFVAYQYFLHVVPTTYIAPRTAPLRTHQYSVTHYTRVLEHNQGTPGIFFKFDLDPLSLTIHQRTPTFLQLVIRCVGVIGGVFVCMGYAIRITTRAVEVVSGADQAPGIVAADASGVKVGLRQKWGGGELRSRGGQIVRQGNGWVLGGGTGSPYASYAGTPVSNGFQTPGPAHSSFLSPSSAAGAFPSIPMTPNSNLGLGLPPSSFGPVPGSPAGSVRSPSAGRGPPRTPRTPNTSGLQIAGPAAAPPSVPSTPASYATFPQSPNPDGSGFAVGPPPRRAVVPKKDD